MFSSPRVFKSRNEFPNRLQVISSWRGKRRVAVAGVLAIWTVLGISSRLARVETQANRAPEKPVHKVTVQAADKSTRLIHLKDGYELSSTISEQANKDAISQSAFGTPLSMTSADFDEDGTPDLVVGYTGGKLALYRGNVDSLRPRSHGAQQRKASGQFTDEPFLPNAQVLDAPESPELIEAGDFNADGHNDILVSSPNSKSIYLLSGTGKATFQAAKQISLSGQVTAMAAGEVGQADGQADVVVGVITPDGPRLVVYEHPESAFKHKPESFPLPGPATEIALGDFDGDNFSDIAVACGDTLTVIHERGQVYPWDTVKGVNLVRPPAIVETRKMQFGIADLAVGDFGGRRVNSLALLADDGSINLLEPTRPKTARRAVSAKSMTNTVGPKFVPKGIDATGLALKPDSLTNSQTPPADGSLFVDTSQSHAKSLEALLKKRADEAAKAPRLSKEEFAKVKAAAKAQGQVTHERAKNAFLQTMSAHASALSRWTLEPNITEAGLSVGGPSSAKRLVVARVSVSGRDDLVVVNSAMNKINIVAQSLPPTSPNGSVRQSSAHHTEVVSLDVTGSPVAVLPLRLNADALSDLVVFRRGAVQPSVVLTTATQHITVNDTGDGPEHCVISLTCTLRDAIEIANHDPGTEIDFNIQPEGVHTIHPLTELPAITGNGTVIDGSTQPGFVDSPVIELRGDELEIVSDGIKIRASNCNVQSLAIFDFPSTTVGLSTLGGNGITLETARNQTVNGNNLVSTNYLGTNHTGTDDQSEDRLGNQGAGLNIFTSDNNTIIDNLMSDNKAGLSVTNGNTNIFQNNNIGLDAEEDSKLPNDDYGVFLTGSNNKFGGNGLIDGNVVSGNGKKRLDSDPQPGCDGYGILIPLLVDVDTGAPLTALNLIKGNKIGTDTTGALKFGNCWRGIETDPIAQTIIGSITQNGRNIVSGNDFDAIWCNDNFDSEGGFCQITGNNIGTDITGTIAIPNTAKNERSGLQPEFGIVQIANNETFSTFGSQGGTTPGGACTGFCNLLSGNSVFTPDIGALLRESFGSVGVFNNYIGTDRTGTVALPNASFGVLTGGGFDGVASETFIGGVSTSGGSLGNVISGNEGGAIIGDVFFNSARGSTFSVEGNLIGTDALGLNAISNGCADLQCGVQGLNVATIGTVQIGDSDPLARNIIAGNNFGDDVSSSGGIFLQQDGGDYGIFNNYIGVNKAGAPLGNSGNGISVRAAPSFNLGSLVIGGNSAAEENLIQNNGQDGIFVAGDFIEGLPAFPYGVEIKRNKIKHNGGLGIDLHSTADDPDGVTDNDCLDVDFGPNLLQNFPELDAPTTNGNGTITVPGKLFSAPNETYTIDFYSNSAADPTNYGEGENFIGSKTVHTNVHGKATFTFTSTDPVSINDKITATATDGDGNTSEFSCAAGLCTEPEPTCPEAIVVNDDGDEPNDPVDPDICDVDPPNNVCTLRAAIQVANHQISSGGATETFIEFDIPGAGLQTIRPATPLPDIAHHITIDATSQPGYDGTPVIELDGEDVGTGVAGLKITGGGATIRGMNITDFVGGDGIRIEGGTGGNKVRACFIGTNPAGTALVGDMAHGIVINNSQGNKIGNASAQATEDDNIIAGCDSDILIQGAASQQNVVAGNLFDLAFDGETGLDNPDGVGVTITDGAQNNTIGGGSVDTQRNQFSSELYGILLTAGAKGNRISANSITTCHVGVSITRASNNTVGGNAATDGNEIGDTDIGIYLGDTDPEPPTPASHTNMPVKPLGPTAAKQSPSPPPKHFQPTLSLDSLLRRGRRTGINSVLTTTTGNSIQGNLIGFTLISNNSEIHNDYGIAIDDASGNLIGGATSELGNRVGFNDQAGVVLRVHAANNTLQRNYIGLSGTLNAPQPNLLGVEIVGSDNQLKLNTISGNEFAGVYIYGSRNILTSNFIGTNNVGADAVHNGDDGITLDGGGTLNIIGPGNVISGNKGAGVGIMPGVSQDTITGNLIGTDHLGMSAIPNKSGIEIEGAANTVSGNTISGNETGIEIGKESSQSPLVENNIIQGNRIGTKLNGTEALPNTAAGVLVDNGADHNVIGAIVDINNNPIELVNGINPAGNLISGNQRGIVIEPGDSDEAIPPLANKVQGNLIGTDKTGLLAIPNIEDGISIVDSSQNLIGGTGAELLRARNIISGNTINGVEIQGTGSIQNNVAGNYIGLQLDGLSPRGNGGNGISILNGVGQNTIQDNVIGGNTGNGVEVNNASLANNQKAAQPRKPSTTSTVKIFGNLIGVSRDAAGRVVSVGNGLAGVHVQEASNVFIGTDTNFDSEAKNIIGGNNGDGVLIEGGDSSGNLVGNAIIGTDENGTAGLGNHGDGIKVSQATATEIIRNAIGGNTFNGIELEDLQHCTVFANTIGLTKKILMDGGSVPVVIANLQAGLKILNSADVEVNRLVDQLAPVFDSVFSANGESGIVIQGPGSANNSIKGTIIGTDEGGDNLGNHADGVLIIDGASHNFIGGPDPGAGDTIAFNGGSGVDLDPSAGPGNQIDPNIIYGNAKLGIDLNSSGVPLINDPGDADGGANLLQNYPQFNSAIINNAGNLILAYKVDSAPANSNYGSLGLYIEFFKGDANLQGKTFIGNTQYTEANYTSGTPGSVTFNAGNAVSLDIHVGDKIVATATDGSGNTSEFTSVNVGVVSAPTSAAARVSGQVTTGDGQPLSGVNVKIDGAHSATTITDSAGRYSFASVETDSFYVVTPERANYTFSPASRSFSLVGNKTDAGFTAVADASETANPLDTPEFFVRQHYLDFLSREPDGGGFAYWTGAITRCGSDSSCLRGSRIDVSNAFFYEQEFQESGAFVYRIYKAGLGHAPRFAEFQPDRALVIGGANLDQRKTAFALAFVQRDAFMQAYPQNQAAEQFVDRLLDNIRQNSVDLAAQRGSLIALYNGTDSGRAAILKAVAESGSFIDGEYNRSFVLTQYFGYLRRDPDEGGYNFWLGQVSSGPLRDVAKQHAMVCSFITSAEYQRRFSTIVTHTDQECR